jgi:hypothetical protein
MHYYFDKILLFAKSGCYNPSVKLHTLHGSVVPTGVTVLLGLRNPPRRGRDKLPEPGLLYPLVWIPWYDTIN